MKKGIFIALVIFSIVPVLGQQVILKREAIPLAIPVSSTQLSTSNTPKQFDRFRKDVIEMDHETALVGKRAPESLNIYEIALFGGYQKTLVQIEQDKSFLVDCEKNFNSKEEACAFFINMGWQYLSEGSKEMATYRFNLAWLLNNENMEVYWGLGVIEYQKGELEEAIKLMSQGIEKDNSQNVSLMVDLATIHINCFVENQHDFDIPKAYGLLEKSIEAAPNFANSYKQLARINLINGQVDEAWMSFHRAFKLDPTTAGDQVLTDLLIRKPDPMSIFHSFD